MDAAVVKAQTYQETRKNCYNNTTIFVLARRMCRMHSEESLGKILIFQLNNKIRVQVWEKDILGHYPIFTKDFGNIDDAESEAQDWILSGYELSSAPRKCAKCSHFLSREDVYLCKDCAIKERSINQKRQRGLI